MRYKSTKAIIVILAVFVLAAACAPGPNSLAGTARPDGTTAGFWQGLWHGIIAPITFIVSLFNSGVNVYEAHNNGGWYNFGFVFGLSIIFGGGGGGAGSMKRRRDRTHE